MAPSLLCMRRHLSYANVVATLALVIALTAGTAVSAALITGKDVKNSSLTGKDVKNSSLTGKDVRSGSLEAADFGAGQLPAGPQGATGPTGPAGADATDPLESGQTVVGGWRFNAYADTTADTSGDWVALGAVTNDPITLPDVMVDQVTPGETCAGTSAAPTAPAGRLCIYVTASTNLQSRTVAAANITSVAQQRGFSLTWAAAAVGSYGDVFVWAYTEP
jgi:hypothetical protein